MRNKVLLLLLKLGLMESILPTSYKKVKLQRSPFIAFSDSRHNAYHILCLS